MYKLVPVNDENTCLIREDLESILVENQSNKTIYKKKGKGVISIAPGENKVGQYDSIYLPVIHLNYKYFF